jgi:hypothetical protein
MPRKQDRVYYFEKIAGRMFAWVGFAGERNPTMVGYRWPKVFKIIRGKK